jgi:gliding motility-associated-like protein
MISMITKALLSRCFLLLLFLICTVNSWAYITIDSTSAIDNTCTNNGSITVFAQSDFPQLIYSIIDGPFTVSSQNSNLFYGLEPGVYQVLVSNFNNDTATTFVAVNGNYVYPDFNISSQNTTCTKSNDGKIFIEKIQGTGNGKYTYKLIDNATQQSTTITSDTIKNLAPSNYTIIATDACGNSTTKSVSINYIQTSIYFNQEPLFKMIGCNVVSLELNLLSTSGNFFLPISLRVATKNGVTTKTANIANGNVLVETFSNIGYGDTLNLQLTNSCGDVSDFVFGLQNFKFNFYSNVTTANCQYNISSGIYTGYDGYRVFLKDPVQYSLTDKQTGSLLQNYVVSNVNSVSFSPQIINKEYIFEIKDGCGNLFKDTFMWLPIDSSRKVRVFKYKNSGRCLDSTGAITLGIENTRSATQHLVITSGPPSIKGTKPNYSYSDVNVYNRTFNTIEGEFPIKNLQVGVYYFQISDDCGNVFNDSFAIYPSDIMDDNFVFSFLNRCDGQNIVLVKFYTNNDSSQYQFSKGHFTLTNLLTNKIENIDSYFYYNSRFKPSETDSVFNLNTGNYQLIIKYEPGFYNQNIFQLNSSQSCWSITKYFTIPPYQRPLIKLFNKISCHGNRFVEFRADSSRGVFPLKFEIISGPQTYAPQGSNVFQLSQTGNYIARITDSCGTSNTFYFSIDTFSFPPITKVGSSCLGGITQLSYRPSSFFTYRWTRPNGTTFTGDTLLISYTTTTDLGVYRVTKIVSYNGCIDSSSTTYILNANKIYYRFDTLCPSQSLTIGTHVYSQTGVYRDTFLNASCDSIVITDLVVDYHRDSIHQTICAGKSYYFHHQNLTSTGIYRDTSLTNNCASITTLYLQVKPYKKGSFIQTTCAGQEFLFANKTYTTTGIYRDTIATDDCDSIVALYLIVKDYLKGKDSATLCAGQSFHLGNQLLTHAGIYSDTLHRNDGCDSIVTFYLNYNPYPTRSIDTSICDGKEIVVWNKPFQRAGTFIDTLATNACDTIFHIKLSVAPTPSGDTTLQTIEMQYEDTVELTACATDATYKWNSNSCQNCETIKVSPEKELSYYQCKIINTFGCSITCQYEVKVDGIFGRLYTPNAFTPNGDNNNDFFLVFGKAIHQNSLKIFNRWGEEVFESSDMNNGWDGTYKGIAQPSGVYVYVLNYFSGIETKTREIKGSLTLIR